MTAATGASLIAAERKRQVEAEGWSLDHDREHGPARLARAAYAYERNDRNAWPFDNGASFKPKGIFRNLVRAGALYQAAMDVADPGSYFSPDYYAKGRDRMAAALDGILTEVRSLDATR